MHKSCLASARFISLASLLLLFIPCRESAGGYTQYEI